MNREQLLSELKPIRLAETTTCELPIAETGFLLLALLALLLLLTYLRKPWRRLRQQRIVLSELNHVFQLWQTIGDAHQFAQSASRLLRRYALLRFPAQKVAGLTGEHWLIFLDQTGGHGFFCSEAGRTLIAAPYSKDALIEPSVIFTAIRQWIRSNR